MNKKSPTRMRFQATLACAGGLVLWWRLGGVVPAAFAGLLTSLALLAWVSPARYVPVQRGFDFVTRCLVSGFSWLMLGAVYFFVFTPLRMIGTLVGRDPLGSRRQRAGTADATTYLRPLPPATPGRFNRQF